MEYISMERSVELGRDGYFRIEFDRAGPHTGYEFSAVELHALYNAAIADYLKGVWEGVELPEPDREWLHYNPNTDDLVEYVKGYAREAIAHYAARLKQVEAVLRMAKEALANANSGNPCPLFADALAAINQQLGEK